MTGPMIIAEWSYNVPRTKRADFLRFIKDETRPLWEAAGASQVIYQCVPKRFFPYQTADDDTRIVELVRFRSLADFEAFTRAYEQGDPRFKALEGYETRMQTTDPAFRVYEELV